MNNVQETYVPWKEGAELLGVKRNVFFYLVETGQVRKEPGRGPRNGRYSLTDIQAVKARRDEGKPRRVYRPRTKRAPVIVDWIYEIDIFACLKLDYIVYDESIVADGSRYQAWVKKNPHIALAAYNAKNRDECLAYVSILPLEESLILDVLQGRRDEMSIQASEIRTYDEPGAYTLLVNSAVAHPDRPDLLFKVLYQILERWIERFPERYVTKIYAQSVSDRGDRMVQNFFMSPRYDLAPNAHMLDMSRPARSRLVRNFQAKLEEKRQALGVEMPEELVWQGGHK